jgi:hypothetical protein
VWWWWMGDDDDDDDDDDNDYNDDGGDEWICNQILYAFYLSSKCPNVVIFFWYEAERS